MTTTHTYVELEVPRTVYLAMCTLMARAEEDPSHLSSATLDLDNIRLVPRIGLAHSVCAENQFLVESLINTAGESKINLVLNTEIAQVDVPKARRIVQILMQCIEAAVSDVMIYRFLTEKLQLEPTKAVSGLEMIREIRQASIEAVNPS